MAVTSPSLAILLAAMLLLWPLRAKGHGFVVEPAARNAQAGPKNGYCPHCGNGNGICGDGNQWPPGSDHLNFYNGPVKTWTAGSIEKIVVKITAHHKGHFEMSMCDQVLSSSTKNPQACLDKWILERASPEEAGFTDCVPNDKRGGCQPLDARHKERFYLPPPSFTPDASSTYEFYVKVPLDLKCEACTMQWRWWSANSCTPAEDYGCFATVLKNNGYSPSSWMSSRGVQGACPGGSPKRGCGEEFRNCVDLTVLPSTGVTATTTTPSFGSTTPRITITNPETTGTPTTSRASAVPACVPQSVLTCINSKSSYWPKCDEGQSKSVKGPAGYEFGHYCSEEWAKSLNEMLSDPAVDKCYDKDVIHKLLAQVAYETGYFSTVYQPQDGGAGMIHMIPGNWPINAKDMDLLFPGHHYERILSEMPLGKGFFQSPAYGWKSVAAWFKLTNRVIGSCGKDLLKESFEEQTRCILSRVVSRKEAFDIVGSCLSDLPEATTTAVVSTTSTTASSTVATTTPKLATSTSAVSTSTTAASTTTTTTPKVATSTNAGSRGCVRNPDCGVNPWCNDPAYDTWCPHQVKFGGPCPSPYCKEGLSTSTSAVSTSTTSPSSGTTTPKLATTTSAGSGGCVRNPDCGVNPWCNDPAYDTWCPQQVKFGGPCPSPHCKEGGRRISAMLRR